MLAFGLHIITIMTVTIPTPLILTIPITFMLPVTVGTVARIPFSNNWSTIETGTFFGRSQGRISNVSQPSKPVVEVSLGFTVSAVPLVVIRSPSWTRMIIW